MSSPISAPTGLARRTLGGPQLLIYAVSASAPMVVLAGSVIATYAATGVRGVPLSFIVLGAVLALFAVGYGAMARHLAIPGPFYAYLAHGLGRVWGVAGGLLALVSYNAIQISLYGLFGVVAADLLGDGSWWVWALLAWVLVGVLGVRRVAVNARVLAVLLAVELAVILAFDFGAATNPAEGASILLPLEPGSLLVAGIGGVFAFGIAAFVGVELPPVYSEEARSGSAVARATLGAVAVICVLYTLSSWAVAVAAGPQNVVDSARDPEAGLPFSLMEQLYGSNFATLANVLLITSMLGAMTSFHNTVARYVFTLARDGVLPAQLGRIGSGGGGGAPISGSLVQSAVALAVIGGFALAGADPVAALFTLLSALAAIGVMTLMVLASVSVIMFFARRQDLQVSMWQRTAAPLLAAALLMVVLVTTLVNLSSLVGSSGALMWVLPGIVLAAVIVGLVWGYVLRTSRPDVFGQVGAGLQDPLSALDHSLERFRV
jgi:amino acid transporter